MLKELIEKELQQMAQDYQEWLKAATLENEKELKARGLWPNPVEKFNERYG